MKKLIFALMAICMVFNACKKGKETEQPEQFNLSEYYIAGTLAPAHTAFIITFNSSNQANFTNTFSANGINTYTFNNGVLTMPNYTFEIKNGSIQKADPIFENPILVKTPTINAFTGKTYGGSGMVNGVSTPLFVKFDATNSSFTQASTLAGLATTTASTTFTMLNNVSFYNGTDGYVFGLLLNNKLEIFLRDKSGAAKSFTLTQQ